MRRAVLTGSLVAAIAGVALAAQPYQTSEYTLSQQRADRPTGEHFKFDYVNPDDPDAKPPAVKKVVTILPKGARYDASGPGSCTASDAELMAQGLAEEAEDAAAEDLREDDARAELRDVAEARDPVPRN